MWCIRTSSTAVQVACMQHVAYALQVHCMCTCTCDMRMCICMYLQHGGADGVVQVVRRRAQQAVQLELLLGGEHLVRVRVRAGVMVMVRPGWG